MGEDGMWMLYDVVISMLAISKTDSKVFGATSLVMSSDPPDPDFLAPHPPVRPFLAAPAPDRQKKINQLSDGVRLEVGRTGDTSKNHTLWETNIVND